MATAYKNVYQFKISLTGIKPTIWRRIQVPETYTFGDLHEAIQDVMGWEDYHLHSFEVLNPNLSRNELIGSNDGGEILSGDGKLIKDYFSLKNKKAIYEYDFGDGWCHNILLEKILTKGDDVIYPVCLAGERACPPEDCGGPYGYENLLNIIKNPRHKEYRDIMEWIDDDFDPEKFQASDIQFRTSDNALNE